ncbi:hypothetical protein [Clostridium sp.]|uniref:hypothetical protein n=1 Tax=Clostridium sp. TaxID=1506 RepID=UPI003F3ED42D
MKVRVKNEKNSDFNKEFKVRRMNYDQVVVNYPSSKGINIFLNNDVEFITESDIDEFLIKNKCFLKIKLNRGISIAFYKVLLDTIQSQFELEIKSLNLLKDKYKVNKRGIWDKEIVCMINDSIPINIIANGENFKKTGYNVFIEEIKKEDFLELCVFEIKKIEKEIEEKQLQLSRYGMAINGVKSGVEQVLMIE